MAITILDDEFVARGAAVRLFFDAASAELALASLGCLEHLIARHAVHGLLGRLATDRTPDVAAWIIVRCFGHRLLLPQLQRATRTVLRP